MPKPNRQPSHSKAHSRSGGPSGSSGAPRPRRNRKRKNWTRIFTNFVIVVGLFALVIWLCVDKRFNIREIRYEGCQTVPPGRVKALGKARYGQNLFIYAISNHSAIVRRIEKGEPAVEEAHIRIKLPHTLLVRVQEREPYAQLRINQGPLLLLDAKNVPYREMAARAPALPAIIVPAGTPSPVLGKKMREGLGDAIGVGLKVTDLLEHGTAFQPLKLREVRVGGDLYTIVQMSDRPLVKLGLPNDLPLKISTAATAINDDPVRAEAAEYVDVTLPSKPAIKMKDTNAKPGIM